MATPKKTLNLAKQAQISVLRKTLNYLGVRSRSTVREDLLQLLTKTMTETQEAFQTMKMMYIQAMGGSKEDEMETKEQAVNSYWSSLNTLLAG